MSEGGDALGTISLSQTRMADNRLLLRCAPIRGSILFYIYYILLTKLFPGSCLIRSSISSFNSAFISSPDVKPAFEIS